ncbi:histidine phosphatase family protein [Roseovarius sp. MBR-78]|uniref:histidine phosphatase family protein n=1 Tax=Roseovarius sp. MBR-78 TaxID=3156460 RepID=UPI0033936E06
MTEIVLVRHGQANNKATDEAGYDRLSPLGEQQARWLGAHLRGTDPHFDRVITGTLNRQRGTAEAMGYGGGDVDARLDELSYFALARAVEAQHGLPTPQDATQFARYLPQVISHWAQGNLDGLPESYESFATRVTGLLDDLSGSGGRVLVVTSGGVIGMALRHALGLDIGGMSKVMLQVMNSSLHRVHHVHDMLMLGAFNATPHLDTPDRAHARTFI